jgi:hypothetical protein
MRHEFSFKSSNAAIIKSNPIREFGVVSLLAILRHNAASFWQMARTLQFCSGSKPISDGNKAAEVLYKHCKELGLTVSLAVIKNSPKDDPHAFFANVANVIEAELGSREFLSIPPDRSMYAESGWLDLFQVEAPFPNAAKELEAAGRCYAYGEPDASMFHSMRALDIVLGLLAAAVGVNAEKNWQNVLNDIEAKLKAASGGPKKTEADKQREHFYAQLAAQFKFFKDGWRNYTMHAKERYSDRDAEQMLKHVEYFLILASEQLKEG